jgi:hypothetical protein
MRKVLIILFLAISSVLSATNYYVKNGGSDAASGTSDATAWAHHPWMSTWTGHVILVAGDNVFMKRDNIWSIATPNSPYMKVGQSGSSGNPITTTWYGTSGSKPVIKITGDYPYSVIEGYGKSFITFDNLEIEHYSAAQDLNNDQIGIKFGKDANNNVPHDWVITNCNIHNIPYIGIYGHDDSYNIIIGNKSATSCATALSFSNHIYDCGYGGIILLGRNPVTNTSNWDVCYNYIHDIDNIGVLRDSYGIAFSSETVGIGQGYSTGWPNNCTAKYNRVENVPGHTGVDCHGGKNIYFLDNYIYDCLHGIIAQAADRSYAETAILDNVYVERNTIENSGNTIVGDYHDFIFVVAENVDKRATNCYIRDNNIFYSSRPSGESGAYGISLYNVDGVTVEGNSIFNGPLGSSSGGIGLSSDAIKKVKNVIVRNNWIYNWDKGIDVAIGSIDGDLTFYNNIVYSHNRPFVGEGGTISYNLKFYNNTFLSAAAPPQPYVFDFIGNGSVTIAKGASLAILNNIIGFSSPASDGIYILAPQTISGTFICDYNLYWNSISSTPFYQLNNAKNWSTWKGLGYDTHSLINTDPLFINKSGSYSESLDFVLQSTSPAINKGTMVSEVTSDFFGNPRDATPDIGAYEYIVQVKGIKVTGAGGSDTITTAKGTLQLISTISPSDAANKTVTWSIVNGTGEASISSAGIVTASSNGTVIARATATDGSGVYGTLIITISYQGTLNIVITVTGKGGARSITTKKGTLQLIASPADQSVTWSIENDTGQASISSAGLVTAITNGTVTAMATVTDGSGVYGTLFITITNQGTSDSTNFKGQPVTIYPNPAHEYINIRIVEQKLVPDFIRIFSLSGKVVLQYKVNPDVTDLHIPLNLIEGIYILQMGSGNTTMFTQKLIVD